ncbi:hypothetical protein Q9966_003952 [Columba livia]|nr:hypothetical protein Q9966_003952 [Columba livia]
MFHMVITFRSSFSFGRRRSTWIETLRVEELMFWKVRADVGLQSVSGRTNAVPGFWSWRRENDVEEAEALMWEGHGITINSSGTSDN